eukprot:5623571-Amphidinium_carterae.1
MKPQCLPISRTKPMQFAFVVALDEYCRSPPKSSAAAVANLANYPSSFYALLGSLLELLLVNSILLRPCPAVRRSLYLGMLDA